MKGLTLNQREQTRLEILNHVLQGLLRVHEAAVLLGVSERQAWRLLAAYRKEGAAALAHGNRGRPASDYHIARGEGPGGDSGAYPVWWAEPHAPHGASGRARGHWAGEDDSAQDPQRGGRLQSAAATPTAPPTAAGT